MQPPLLLADVTAADVLSAIADIVSAIAISSQSNGRRMAPRNEVPEKRGESKTLDIQKHAHTYVVNLDTPTDQLRIKLEYTLCVTRNTYCCMYLWRFQPHRIVPLKRLACYSHTPRRC